MLTAIDFQDVELDDWIYRGDQDLTSPHGQRLVRRLKIGIADGVEHDVGALAFRELAHAGCDVRCRCVDDFDFCIGVAFIGLALAHHADHARAVPARRKPSIAVTKGTPIPAASSQDRLFGFSTTASASTARCVAWVPSRRMPRSPDEPNTSRPIQSAGPSITIPA